MENIDYEALKKRGLLRQKQAGFFVLRTRMLNGVYTKEHLEKLSAISQKYARGIVHVTVRQGIEIPFIKLADISRVEDELKSAGIQTGASGARLRTTTCCPGNNWCKSGLVNTFALSQRIEKELQLICGLDLPHKFKIAISGCPNACTRVQFTEIGIHGAARQKDSLLQFGYTLYLGGCGGRNPKAGFKLDKFFSEDEILALTARVVKFYQEHAQPRQRLALLIEEFGRENFLKEISPQNT